LRELAASISASVRQAGSKSDLYARLCFDPKQDSSADSAASVVVGQASITGSVAAAHDGSKGKPKK
jgi:hypothetical protein